MLTAAGVEHRSVSADVDEATLKRVLDGAEQTAIELAMAKAEDISRRSRDDWVIGGDSVVAVEGRLFDKPRDRDEAAEHLRFFSGKAMQLTSAAALARDGKVDWCHADSATLHVRRLSDSFIDSYLDGEWPEVSYCVGVFRLEGPGVQLFERIDGDHFTILGLPLIPLLGALRERGVLPA